MNLKTTTIPLILAFLCLFFSIGNIQGQSFGTVSSAVWINNCNPGDFYNVTGGGANLIGPAGNVFTNTNLGVYTQNSGTLSLGGAEIRTTKEAVANVCSARMYYRVYLQSSAPGAFTSINLSLADNCDVPSSQYPSGGACQAGEQKWNHILPVPVNLTTFAPGNYVLEVYYDVAGSHTTADLCDNTVLLNDAGNNYKAFFSIQSPVLASNNPTTCNGTEGLITISGLVAGATYDVNYTDDGVPVGPVSIVANGAGQVIISGLDAGVYANFELLINGCSTDLFTGIILSNPVFTPTFTKIASFCAGSIQPILNPISNNGFTGTWSPAVVNNQSSGTYTFTPTSGQCAIPFVMTVTVIQKTNPSFLFGTSLTICSGGTVPTLPNTSTNGISGTWSPAVVSNTTSGVYTFTPTAGTCANPRTFTVTVTPNETPAFSFGTALTMCEGDAAPALPATSTNGITGTWSPATVSNTTSATYTFTPTAGQCAVATTLAVTVNPNVTPTFNFGTSQTICAGAAAPILPTTSIEGITGTWNPAVVNDQASGTYTFTPTAGLCALPTSFSVTVTQNITPTFAFGTATTICANGAVPSLPTTSTNGITGTWNPAIVDNQNSGIYTFTPTAGLCATTTTFTVTIAPNVAPSFAFGTTLTICTNGTVPSLPTTSTNGITGTWSPSSVSNTASGTYTFTPTAGLCALPATFDVTVNPNVTPTFAFGTSSTICSGGTVPSLPNTSTEAITGTWNPAVVSNTASGTYTFTPTAGLCAVPTTFSVTVTPNIVPSFAFGTSSTICANATVPTLPNTSTNGITGTWSPATVDNQNSGIYTFTPTAGLCATTQTFTVTVNPNITPTFSFGTASTICAGSIAPALPTTSTNGITGTWSPATVNNQNSGTYTFTPTAGLCALPTTFTVTVTPNVTPTFAFGTSLTICVNGTVPTLTNTSSEGITGTWSPAVVSNAASGVYTFTPTAGLCATTQTFTVTVNPNIVPSFAFGTSLTICANGTVPALTNTSTNGITGTWNPAVVDNQNSGVYTFTPDAGLCALPATFTVTVNPNITPAFSFGTAQTICLGGTAPSLPATSTNGITGTWNPATVSNQANGTYTFTPSAGQCALPTTFTVTVASNITPTFSFGTTLTICAGGIVPVLPGTSDNGISGTWNPATVSNQTSGVYSFTPAIGVCATATTFTITVTPNITPAFSFGTSLTICANAAVPILSNTSDNGVTGTWNPAIVDDQASGVYTFTPAAGICALPATFTVTVNPNITPLFSFGTATIICNGATTPVLPTTSSNGITGTWNPATISNQTSGTYTFTPTAVLCATITTFDVTVTPNVTPTFSFGTSLTICAGGTVPALPASSDNGIGGTWNPAVVNDQASGTYTFTPNAGVCATTQTFTVTVNPNITPTFSFGTSLSICTGAAVPSLPTVSSNGINGTWSFPAIDNMVSRNYTFTPNTGECATITALSVTVNPIVTPTFDFGTSTIICSGDAVPSLPTASTNGINGTWNPAVVDNQSNGTYTFTPNADECAIPTTFTVTVTPSTIPVFDFGTSLTICTGGTVPTLPGVSTNGVNGTWNPATASNQTSGTYTFTPAATPDQCIRTVTFTVTVKPILTPTFSFGTAKTICSGSTAPVLPTTSDNGITGTWAPATVNNQVSGTYTFTSAPGQCAAATATFAVTITPIPTAGVGDDTTVNDGALIPESNFAGTPSGITFNWTNSNPAIGLPASGTGNTPAFTGVNKGNTPISGTITVTPVNNGCAGADKTYVITVNPLNKDVFVPNVFSPNGDGKNDILYAYGNYIKKLDMRIFNQWGEQVIAIADPAKGWDGTHRGKPQPVGVYVYVLQAELEDGRTVKLKGSITLLR